MENVYNVYADFIDKQIVIKQYDDTTLTGTLISVDGYLNIFLINGKYNDENFTFNFKSMFVRGSVVDYIYIADK